MNVLRRIFDTKAKPLYNTQKFFLLFFAINLITLIISLLIDLGIQKESLAIRFGLVNFILMPIILLDALDAITSYCFKDKPLLNTGFDTLVLLAANIGVIIIGQDNYRIKENIVLALLTLNILGIIIIIKRHNSRKKQGTTF
jgi:hypothetical protein